LFLKNTLTIIQLETLKQTPQRPRCIALPEPHTSGIIYYLFCFKRKIIMIINDEINSLEYFVDVL